MTLVLLLIPGADAWWTRLAGGAATHLSSHARHPRPATSDKTNGSQASPADSLKVSQLAARSGPSRPRRTSPTARSKTASLDAIATIVERGPIGSSCAADVVPMHRVEEVRPSGASVGRPMRKRPV